MKVSKLFIAATKDFSDFGHHVPAPLFRRSFTVEKPVESATVTVCGLGFYEFCLNGEKLNKSLLSTYITNPDKLLYYDSYDLSERLKPGKNTLGFILGNGFLNNPGGTLWGYNQAEYRSAPKLAVLFTMKYTDGERVVFEADERFLTHPSHILFDDLRAGEIADGRLLIPDWAMPDYDDSGWTPAIEAETPWGFVTEADIEPVAVTEKLPPVRIYKSHITKLPPVREGMPDCPIEERDMTGYIYDFGVNSAGTVTLRIKGKPGQRISILFGETLAEDGGIDLRNMEFFPHNYIQRLTYFCRGDGETEEYTTRFTYFGFRYCLVSGLEDSDATEDLLEYDVMHTDIAENAAFNCSDGIINRLYRATQVSNYANLVHIPTDCPHREKNGWTGDASISAEQMLINLKPERLFREWLKNVCAFQRGDGALSCIVPTAGWGYDWGTGPAWDCHLIFVSYFLWRYRGDIDTFSRSACNVVDYLCYMMGKRDEKGLFRYGLGDWCQVGLEVSQYSTPVEVTDTLYCLLMCRRAAEMFRACGRNEFAEFAESKHGEILADARRELIEPDGKTVRGRTQTGQTLGIAYGLFTPEETDGAFRVLLDIVHEKGDKIDMGILGCREFFHLMADRGEIDLAYRMLRGPEYPSFGYSLEVLGGTALPEKIWKEGERPLSFNHHFFGDISAFFICDITGIRVNPDNSNPNSVLVSPHLPTDLDFAEASVGIECGRVESRVERKEGKVILTVTVPEGATAILRLADGEKTLKAGTTTTEI